MAGKGKRKPPYTAGEDAREFFERIRTVAPPSSIDTDWIKAKGLAKSQPVGVGTLVRWLGIANDEGVVDKDRWNSVRAGPHSQENLQTLISEAYAEIFGHFDDVKLESREQIASAFIAEYGVGDPGRYVKCFLAVCEVAGFAMAALTGKGESGSPSGGGGGPAPRRAKVARARKPTVRVEEKKGNAAPRETSSQRSVSITLSVEIPAAWSGEEVRDRIGLVVKAIEDLRQ